MTAYQHIKKYGWQQGGYGTKGKPCCLIGVLSVLYPTHTADQWDRIIDRVKACLPKGIRNLVQWNDRKCRTKEQVLDVLKKARV